MRVIAILNQKGGVGKTTSVATIGHGMAREGYHVLLVDLDAQGNVADVLGLKKSDALKRFLIDEAGSDAIAEARPNLDVIMGDKTTAAAKQTLAGWSFREQVLRNALGKIGDPYDFAILDAAPGVDVLQVSALVACDYFIIPVALDRLAVVGAGDALASAASLTQAGALHARFLGVLPTMWERTTKESHEQLDQLVSQFKKMVWPPVLVDVKAREAPAFGQTLWEYAPGCRALEGIVNGHGKHVGGYRQVIERLLKEIG